VLGRLTLALVGKSTRRTAARAGTRILSAVAADLLVRRTMKEYVDRAALPSDAGDAVEASS
jgi:hypothetical protein